MASTYLTRTPASNGNLKTMTFSVWFKRSKLGTAQTIVSTNYVNDSLFLMQFNTTDTFTVLGYSGAGVTTHVNKITNRVFRDTSAWYHLVVVLDSTNATAEDRCRIFINGERETSFSTNSNPPLDRTFIWNTSTHVNDIGHYALNGAQHFDGSMSHFHFIDGTAYDATAFGEYDANGVWKIIVEPSVTYGTNGFFILKDGNSVTDQSGNGNNYTVAGGTLTNTEDSPSNVFATMNPLGNYVAPTTLSQGNNTVAMTTSKGGNLSTIACTSGKYYAEMKIATMPDSSRFHFGILPQPVTVADDPIATGNDGIMLSGYNATIYANSGAGSTILDNFYGNATGRFSGNPILGLAVDLSSATKTMAISINGAWVTGSNTTDTDFANALKVDITTPLARWSDWFMGCGSGNGTGTTGVYNWNFGNGYFGTTAVASAQNPDDGIGIFEYSVPTGYKALCTKSINAQEYS